MKKLPIFIAATLVLIVAGLWMGLGTQEARASANPAALYGSQASLNGPEAFDAYTNQYKALYGGCLGGSISSVNGSGGHTGDGFPGAGSPLILVAGVLFLLGVAHARRSAQQRS